MGRERLLSNGRRFAVSLTLLAAGTATVGVGHTASQQPVCTLGWCLIGSALALVYFHLCGERTGRVSQNMAVAAFLCVPPLLHGLLLVLAREYGALLKTARIDSMVTYGLWGLGFACVLGVLWRLADERTNALPSFLRGLLLGGVLAVPLLLGGYLCHTADFSVGETALVAIALLLPLAVPLLLLPAPGEASRPLPTGGRVAVLLVYALLLLGGYGAAVFAPLPTWGTDLRLYLLLFGYLLLRLGLDPKVGRGTAWLCRFGGLLLLPAVGFLLYDLCGKLLRYGCTPFRIVGVLLAMAFLLPIIGSLFGMGKRRMLLIGAILVLAVTLPPQNPITISVVQQEAALRLALHDAGMLQNGELVPASRSLSDSERARIRSGADFLQSVGGRSAFSCKVRAADWYALLDEEKPVRDAVYVLHCSIESIDTSRWGSLHPVETTLPDADRPKDVLYAWPEDGRPLPLGVRRRFSLGGLIEKALTSHRDPSDLTNTDMCIVTDGMVLYMDNLTFTYHAATGRITDISLSGFVLSDPR